MKKIYFLIYIIFLSFYSSLAQKEHNIWYFGYNAGVDFNSGSPVALTNSAMNQYEGCSSICDANGNILFYTDGITIWDKTHTAMSNGTGLSGNLSATQSGLIVKQPGNTNLYYVFTTNTTFNYSIVDITLNGGLGAVTATKNIFLVNGSEKQCAVRHVNGTDVWIMSHESYTNGFNAFLLTAAGLNTTPVKSNAGIADANILGGMKFSPVGDKVAYGMYDPSMFNTVCVADFNNATGVVSGGFTIPGTTHQCYGLSFSPDGSKLYAGANFDNNIFQYDMNAGTPAAIIASAVKIGSTTYTVGTLQIAPDQKIYISPQSSGYLDVINNPNTAGIGCNYVDSAVYLSGKICGLGLPNYVVDAAAHVPPPVALFQASDSNFCSGNCISFTNLSTNGTSWQWIFTGANPSSSSDQNPQTICYLDSGIFNATLIAVNSGGRDTLTFMNYINVHASPPTPIISDTNNTLYCSFDSSYTGYQWYNDTTLIQGATNSFYVVTQSGNYNVSVKNATGCAVAVGINVVLSVQNIVPGNSLAIFPNPVHDQLFISGLLKSKTEFCTITIFNGIGELVYIDHTKQAFPNTLQTINCKDFSPGIYFIEVIGDGERYSGKFMKE